MSEVHHREARRLLPILYGVARNGRMLTYQTAARELGRDPNRNARTLGQICNLLDVAAVWADVPLLALFYVRDAAGNINRKAFADAALLHTVVEKAKRHTFTETDIRAIERALDDLNGMGGIKAWAFVRRRLSRQELRRRLSEPESAIGTDAINDIAVDATDDYGSDAPQRMPVTTHHYLRNERIRQAVLRRARGKCEFCGAVGFERQDGSRYLETHHIIALANDGADRLTNVIALCANDHRKAHFGRDRSDLEQQMISIVKDLAGSAGGKGRS